MNASNPPACGLAGQLADAAHQITRLALWVVGGLSLLGICWLLVARAQAELRSVGEVLQLQLGREVGSLSRSLADLSERTLVRNALVDPAGRDGYLRPTLDEYHRGEAALHGLWLTDHVGQTLVSSESQRGHRLDTDAIRQLASEVMSAEQARYAWRRLDGRWLLLQAHPVRFATTGTVEGALVAEIDVQAMVAHWLADLPEPFRAELRSQALILVDSAQAHGRELSLSWDVAAAPLAVPLTLSVHLDLWRALAPAGWVAAIYAVLGSVLLRLVRQRIRRRADASVQPLQRLEQAACQIALEGLEQIPCLVDDHLQHGSAEVRSLAASFEAMLARLHEAQATLEQAVASRTAELAQAKQRLDSTLASLADGVYSLSLDRETLLYASPPVWRLLGLPATAVPLVNDTMRALLGTDQWRLLDAALEGAHGREPAVVRLALPGKGDGPCWIENRMSVIRDAQGQPLRIDGILSDISAAVRSQIEREAAAADLRLRTRAVDASSNGIVVADMRLPGMRMVFVNDGFTRVTGYSREQVLGRSCSFLQGDDKQQPALADLRAAIGRGQPCRVVLRNYRQDGELFINDLAIAPICDELTGELTHYVGVLTDITEQYRSERLLRDQFARLDTLFQLSPDGFVSFDRDDRVASVNQAFERLTGLARDGIVGLDLAAFDALLDMLVEQRDPPGMAHWLPDSTDGETRSEVLLLRAAPPRVLICSRRYCDAPNVSSVLYLRDISRETEVDRMKSEFLSTAAHELRTPMASIRGFSDLLLLRRFDEERTRDVLQTINRQAIWLTNMINELLDLARIEARKSKDFQFEEVRLGELIDAGIKALLVPGDQRTVQRGHEPEVRVRADRAKFQHALTNVLSNAYKYSPGGGAIELRVQRRHGVAGPQVGLVVRDHGIGLRPEHAARAFERFFRADSSGSIPGTGLGLALVKEIIELHGGQVELDSVHGQGTTVSLWLPECSRMSHAHDLPQPCESCV